MLGKCFLLMAAVFILTLWVFCVMTSLNENIFRVTGPWRGKNHRSLVDSPHKSQWRGALKFSLIWTNGWACNRDGGDLIRHRAHYDVTVILITSGPLRKKRKVVIDDALRHTTHVFMLKGICHNISILVKYLLKCVTPISANPECVIQQGRSLPLEYLENSIDIIHMI